MVPLSDVAICRCRPYFRGMNEQTSSPCHQKIVPQSTRASGGASMSPRPVQIGRVNWVGLWTLYMREVQRFAKVAMQTVIALVITSMLFLMVFAVAVGERAQLAGDTDFIAFWCRACHDDGAPERLRKHSSSLLCRKCRNIVDLWPPSVRGTSCRMAAGGMTRGIGVGLVAAVVLGMFGGLSMPAAPLTALAFLILGSLALSFAGILAGIWANKFDEMAAITNFLIQPLAFLSGTFYSVERLPAPLTPSPR